jgi:hypothetical protein
MALAFAAFIATGVPLYLLWTSANAVVLAFVFSLYVLGGLTVYEVDRITRGDGRISVAPSELKA